MRQNLWLGVLSSILLACKGGLVAEEIHNGEAVTAGDKSRYTVFNPVPDSLMRGFATDRPDTTESPYTVDAGHIQLEMSLVDYTRDRGVDILALAPVNFKIGLLDRTDLQLVVDPYIKVEGDGEESEGTSDFQVRLKNNLWGNDEGETACAFMPFLSFPTGSKEFTADHVEGGVIVPLLFSLSETTSLTVMGEVDFVRNEENNDYQSDFVHTASFGAAVSENAGLYVEYIGVYPSKDESEYRVAIGTGATYLVADDVQLDIGMNTGLNGAADDINPFVGISLRR